MKKLSKNKDNTTRIVFDIKCNEKECEKKPMRKYDHWTQINNMCSLACDTGIEIGQNAVNHGQVVMIYDNTYAHILNRVAKIMRNLSSLVEYQGGTMEVVREQEED